MNGLIIIIGILGAFIILFNPFIGMLTTVALIPQALIPATGGSFFGTFTMITPIKIVGALTFVTAFFHYISKKKKSDILKHPIFICYAWFLIYIIISGFIQPGSFTRENFTVFISQFCLGYATVVLVDSPKRFRLVVWAALLSIGFVACKSIVSYSSMQSSARMSGASYDPNFFAIGLLPFIGISFYNVNAERTRLLKLISLACFVVLTCALVITVSRGGILGLAGMALFAFLKSKKKGISILFLAIGALILISFMPQQVWERFKQTKIENVEVHNSTTESTERRLLLVKAAWSMFLDHPIFGVGVGNYYWECGSYQRVFSGRAHMTYLEIMAELGIIGFLIFLKILHSVFKALKKISSNSKELSSYATGLHVGLMGFLVAALFLHSQQDKNLWFVIFMAAALDNIYKKQRDKNPTPQEPKRPKA